MGFNSVLVVLNDRLDEIAKDPKFGEKVRNAIRGHSKDPDRRYNDYITGQTQVISVEHADCAQIVVVGGNTGRVLGYGGYRQQDDDLIKDLERRRKMRARTAKAAKAAST